MIHVIKIVRVAKILPVSFSCHQSQLVLAVQTGHLPLVRIHQSIQSEYPGTRSSLKQKFEQNLNSTIANFAIP